MGLSYAEEILSISSIILAGGSARREVGIGLCIWTHIWVWGGLRGSAMVPFERAMAVSYRLSIMTISLPLISNHSAAICLRMSSTLKSTWMGHFGAKFGVEEIDRRPM